jgi:hypothetical protein
VFTVKYSKQRSKVVKDWYGCVVRNTYTYPARARPWKIDNYTLHDGLPHFLKIKIKK